MHNRQRKQHRVAERHRHTGRLEPANRRDLHTPGSLTSVLLSFPQARRNLTISNLRLLLPRRPRNRLPGFGPQDLQRLHPRGHDRTHGRGVRVWQLRQIDSALVKVFDFGRNHCCPPRYDSLGPCRGLGAHLGEPVCLGRLDPRLRRACLSTGALGRMATSSGGIDSGGGEVVYQCKEVRRRIWAGKPKCVDGEGILKVLNLYMNNERLLRAGPDKPWTQKLGVDGAVCVQFYFYHATPVIPPGVLEASTSAGTAGTIDIRADSI
ncbi:hypothetical protein C8Q78DRAFT_491530 [Trametes maxima]|nr:hypothetical protein C8Q78DRAFT_491530 [Trametes maxima]